MLNRRKVVIAAIVLTGSLLFRSRLEELFESFKSLVFRHPDPIDGVFSAAQLSEYDGIKNGKLYLALMGVIYDVTEGKRHYSKGAPYHYFIGKDGSRAFITGDFQDESADRDHVLSLTCDELFSLVNWKNTLKEKYGSVGKLIGRFYDYRGKETEYSRLFDDKVQQCSIERENAKKQEARQPPCNMEWTSNEGTRVWCTKTRQTTAAKKSIRTQCTTMKFLNVDSISRKTIPYLFVEGETEHGGVSRSWAGVPRQLYSPGGQEPRCVCINPDEDNSSTLLKTYKDCLDTSSSCYVKA